MLDSCSPASRIGYAGLPNLILTQMLNQRNPVKPSGHVPDSSRIAPNALCSYSVTVIWFCFLFGAVSADCAFFYVRYRSNAPGVHNCNIPFRILSKMQVRRTVSTRRGGDTAPYLSHSSEPEPA